MGIARAPEPLNMAVVGALFDLLGGFVRLINRIRADG